MALAILPLPFDLARLLDDAVHRFATEQGHELTGVRWEIYRHGHEDPISIEICWLLAD